MKVKLFISSFTIFLVLSLNFVVVNAQKFTIPVLPDTQESVCWHPPYFDAQMNWLAAKCDSMNTPIVLHVGDVVNYDNHGQWKIASDGMKKLDDAGIPYAFTLGNHDTSAVGEDSPSAAPGNVNANLRKTEKFNQYFPVSRFSLQKGRYEANKSDNAYYTFEAGGAKWIVVTLEFCARRPVAQWMSSVLAQFPEHNAIIVTHFHLTGGGAIANSNAGYGDMNVTDIFNQYIKPHKNVLLVLSGHTCTTSWRTDVGTQGNTIYQILQDYQCDGNWGGAYIRLLDIDIAAKTIDAKMYSPEHKKTLTDNSKFSFQNVNFIAPAPSGVDYNRQSETTIYPNPAGDKVYIRSSVGETCTAKLYDLQGNLLTETREKEINLTNYNSGVYLINVDGKHMKLIKK